jgi:hypothetical protein
LRFSSGVFAFVGLVESAGRPNYGFRILLSCLLGLVQACRLRTCIDGIGWCTLLNSVAAGDVDEDCQTEIAYGNLLSEIIVDHEIS